jgi:membrane protease YdiL (CAAX protease family)
MTKVAIEKQENQKFRVPFVLKNTILLLIGYVAVLLVMQLISGVKYTEVSDSVDNFAKFALYPVGVASIYLVLAGLYTGWIKTVWKDIYQIKGHRWLHIFSAALGLGIIISLVSGNIASQTASFLAVALVATILVGFSEELMFRGYILQGARGSGYTEKRVLGIVMLVFGLFHAANLLTGSPISAVIPQIINAGVLGGGLYMIFRKSGSLILPIALHALTDFALLTKGTSQVGDPRQFLVLHTFVMPVVIIVSLILALKYIDVDHTAGTAKSTS